MLVIAIVLGVVCDTRVAYPNGSVYIDGHTEKHKHQQQETEVQR